MGLFIIRCLVIVVVAKNDIWFIIAILKQSSIFLENPKCGIALWQRHTGVVDPQRSGFTVVNKGNPSTFNESYGWIYGSKFSQLGDIPVET